MLENSSPMGQFWYEEENELQERIGYCDPPIGVSLFSGAGGFELGFAQAGFDVRVMVEYEEEACDTLRLNMDCFDDHTEPTIIQEDIREVGTSEVLEAADVGVGGVTVIYGGPPCLSEGHPIITRDGHVDISYVQVGDKVLTHKGEYREVTDRGGKHYDGELVLLNLKYRPETIKITENHPILTNKGWVKAGDITEEHSIRFPRRMPNQAVTRIEYEYETKLNQHATETKTAEIGTEAAFRFFGAYVAEGWRRKTGGDYEISLAVHEDDVERTRRWIRDAWGEETRIWTKSTEGKCVKITFCHEGVWKFLSQFGDGARNKRLPEWFHEEPEWQIKPFLDAYVACDGSEDENRIRYSTASRELAYDIQRVWSRAYQTLPSVRKEEHQGHSVINGRKIERNDIYVGRIPKSGENITDPYRDESGIYVDVYDVSREPFDGIVYNLEVADHESYCTPLASLHNCQGFSVAGNRDPDDERNALYREMVRIVHQAKPVFFVMENVPSLATMKDGEIIQQVCDEFRQGGYDVMWDILNAANYGVPQRRKRTFIIGKRLDVMAMPAFGNPQIHIGAKPGNVHHPEFFREKHDLQDPEQQSLDAFTRTTNRKHWTNC